MFPEQRLKWNWLKPRQPALGTRPSAWTSKHTDTHACTPQKTRMHTRPCTSKCAGTKAGTGTETYAHGHACTLGGEQTTTQAHVCLQTDSMHEHIRAATQMESIAHAHPCTQTHMHAHGVILAPEVESDTGPKLGEIEAGSQEPRVRFLPLLPGQVSRVVVKQARDRGLNEIS